MCHYITAALPESVDLRRLKGVLAEHRQVLRPAENAFVQAQLPAGAQYLSCTRKHCDCGTALGWLEREEARTPPEADAEKLRRKGWSEARIRRWADEKTRAEAQVRRSVAGGTPHEAAQAWAAYIQGILGASGVPWFGLLLHWYRGCVETERIRLAETVELRAAALDAEAILRMREDVFYRFL